MPMRVLSWTDAGCRKSQPAKTTMITGSAKIPVVQLPKSETDRLRPALTAGTLAVSDPNHFTRTVELWTTDTREWQPVEPSAGYADAGRGYGLADLARALETDRPHRASGALALHVLEVMDAVARSSAEHVVVPLTTTVDRPEPVPAGSTPDSW